MDKLFAPMIVVMNRLKFTQKFAIIFTIFAIPLVALTSYLVINVNDQIKFTSSEKAGLEYNSAVRDLVQNVQRHRGTTAIYLGGNESALLNLEQLQRDIQKNIEGIDSLDLKYGDLLQTTGEWQKIKANWLALANTVTSMPLQQAVSDHTNIIQDLLLVIVHVGDTSGLILDPELSTYHLANIIMSEIPRAIEYMGQARATGSGVLSRRELTEDERIKLQFLTEGIDRTLRDSQRAVGIVYRENPEIKGQLEELNSLSFEAISSLVSTINNEILYTQQLQFSN